MPQLRHQGLQPRGLRPASAHGQRRRGHGRNDQNLRLVRAGQFQEPPGQNPCRRRLRGHGGLGGGARRGGGGGRQGRHRNRAGRQARSGNGHCRSRHFGRHQKQSGQAGRQGQRPPGLFGADSLRQGGISHERLHL
ncbi:magnetosome protein Mad7 [Fundidesulfovibrio magnetotacticus]|uniref:Magnetosome protein Mad7 n=1 Tax=Fundidesulfovibrio magnetotacticus TaxID=2730080 RepID=A0A6V8LQ97_9BACT|nr:magnetosome protein Mad7 [Fundidesulfovibrio magnetotacticus]